MDIDILIEDLDVLVDMARENTTIGGWLGLANSATQIKNILEKQIPKRAEYHHKADGECALVICPSCENRVMVTKVAFPLDRYCKECGQHYTANIANWGIEE